LQTRFGGPDAPPEERGNCFVSCIATIFECTIEEVPDVCAADDGWDEIVAWLLARGWYILEKEHDPTDSWVPGWTIMGVGSRNPKIRDATDGGGHVVVAKDGVPWFNPHPEDLRDAEELLASAANRGNKVTYVLYPLDATHARPPLAAKAEGR